MEEIVRMETFLGRWPSCSLCQNVWSHVKYRGGTRLIPSVSASRSKREPWQVWWIHKRCTYLALYKWLFWWVLPMQTEFRIRQCTAYSNERHGSPPSMCVSSPGFNVIVETRLSSKKGSLLFELLMLYNNRTDTDRSIYSNKVNQSIFKAHSLFPRLFSCI